MSVPPTGAIIKRKTAGIDWLLRPPPSLDEQTTINNDE